MADDLDNLQALQASLYRLAEFVELAQQVPPEDRARLERMIAQARQAVFEARRGKQPSLERRARFKAIVLRHLVEGTHPKAGLRIKDNDTSR
jgi:hypothetical protein